MPKMRAKMKVNSVEQLEGGSEKLKMSAVCKSGTYPADGSDEDNSFACWTPSASLEMHVSNPALAGQIKPGQKFNVDFTLVE
jgi:hypothetical protein